MHNAIYISSLQNAGVKKIVKLRKKSFRDASQMILVEGYREITRAVEHAWLPRFFYFCEEMFMGGNEVQLIEVCRTLGAELFQCSPEVFCKMAYRDRPEGLLAVGPPVRRALEEVNVGRNALFVVAESIEKPGNLGTILRSADGAGVDAVVVCDRCTDIHNPNVVRSSLGTLFSIPVVECCTGEVLRWLKQEGIRILAATPCAEKLYFEEDLTQPLAIVVGTEQLGLSEVWLAAADIRVRIPMAGHVDSLNVAVATSVLLYEAVRQRERR